MTETRVQFNKIVKNQLPAYIREEFPLISEFLSQYYISQEFKGAPIDLIQNIDQYVKVDNITNITDSLYLLSGISDIDTTITIDVEKNKEGTTNFPESYGLIQIDDEIITYTSKTFNSFVGCIRGFSGISAHNTQNVPDQLTFKSTESSNHSAGVEIKNLSSLFLKEFLSKIKYQFSPGFENRELNSELNQNLFLKQIRDFYQSKGTDESFKMLFKILYGEDVKINRPKENLFRPSDARYRLSNDLVAEVISGTVTDIVNNTLEQQEYGDIPYARSAVTYVEKITSKNGKDYYKLSLDSGYNKDIIVDGSTTGKFTVHPSTKIIGTVFAESSVFDVDSTVGFPLKGDLLVTYDDQTTGIVSYTSKSLTQFFGCSNVIGNIADGQTVGINTYATAYNSDGSLVKLRITSVLNSVEIVDDTRYYADNDTSIIKTLGVNSQDITTKDWFFNIPFSYEVESVESISLEGDYRITTKIVNNLKKGDSISIIGNSGIQRNTIVNDLNSDRTFTVKTDNILLTDNYTVKRLLSKANSSVFSSTSLINADVQNVYKIKERTLISSPSIPSYSSDSTDRSVTFGGTFSGTIFNISPNSDHGLYTGDRIYYTPEKTTYTYLDDEGGGTIKEGIKVKSSLFGDNEFIITGLDGKKPVVNRIPPSEGLYFVKRIDQNKISLSKTNSNIFYKKFISISDNTVVENNKIELFDLAQKTLNTQKLLREISPPISDGNTYQTNAGFTGILVNGVEILNYKSTDKIYYGQLENVRVTSSGSGYDIINPPVLDIVDELPEEVGVGGTGARGFCAVSGSLQEIRIVDPGFDYVDTPIIKITGGNGTGARASANMKLINHESVFNSENSAKLIGIGTTLSTIGFTTYHKFRNGERVIYKTGGQKGISGLTTDSSYFVAVQNNQTVKLHKSLNDAVSGINTVTLLSYGTGNHNLQSYNQKLVIGSINVESPGNGYENKKRTASSSGINTSISTIQIKSHDYESGETLVYTTDSTPISGLSTNTQYIVTKVDNDTFKLSQVGIGTDDYNFYYQTKQYVNLTSIGSGTHTFNYPEIKVEVIGKVGISSIGTKTFDAVLQPIFTGEITSVHLSSGGVGYGCSDIINLNRKPSFILKSGKSAQLTPVVSSDGRIIKVIINNSGSEYNAPPTLVIEGSGTGAVLTPIISNGQLTSVNIINSGTGYFQESTSITVIPAGSSATFNGQIQSWTINLYEKYNSSITSDDGFIRGGLNESYGLQYSHIYAPRKLRENVLSLDSSARKVYGDPDLIKNGLNGPEINSTNHSPIIGWAYDGNPIYGPYGYVNGTVQQLKSGYKQEADEKSNRPPLNLFGPGFFVEDFTYYKKNDSSALDENNGRFCITPEFPNGTYAYFASFNLTSDDSGKFAKYKRPIFPYLIGNSYKSKPINFNFSKNSNQDQIDLNKTNWARNTYFYNLVNENASYDYITTPNDLNQTVDVKFASAGKVESIGIITGGQNYVIGDFVLFDNTNSQGINASASVSQIKGKEVSSISVATSSIFNTEIYPSNNKGEYIIFTNEPHNFSNNDIISISGLNTTSSQLEGTYNIKVSPNTLTLLGSGTTLGIASTSVTGIVTYINVGGNLDYPNIRENDILSLEDEKLKVLNVDKLNSRIRVIRAHENTVGSAHSLSVALTENTRKLKINSKSNNSYSSRINKEIYFNPRESIGLGTVTGVGIGTTISFSNPGAGITQVFIPTKSIYIPNHGLQTGDLITYSNNGGDSIVAYVGVGTSTITFANQSNLYVAKISNDLIGIATVRVGLGTTGTFVGIASTQRSSSTLYFVGVGSGVYHSFKTNFDFLRGNIERNIVTVSCASSHGLSNNDTVHVEVNPSISTSFVVRYNDYNRKLIVNPKSFSASGVNTSSNTINIPNHGFFAGQKIIYTASSPSGGLQNQKQYYIVIVDKNNVKLSNTFYGATKLRPDIVGITSASDGNILPINPPLTLYKNSEVSFDLSDSSLSYINQSQRYPAFSLDFYKDSNYTQIFESSQKQKTFEVKKFGTVGVTNDAKVTITVNSNIPQKLYYKLTPVYDNSIPEEKKNISIDTEVLLNNQIDISGSEYNGTYNIVSSSSTNFTYTVRKTPENSTYVGSSSSIFYFTDSLSASGSISEVQLISGGYNYYSLPGISSVISQNGTGAILEAFSESIGQIKKNKINDIGFDFPCDFTLRPSISLTQIIKIEPLSSLQSVRATSFGKGYTEAPKLLLLDGKTNKVVPEVDLRFTLGKNNVEILKNAYSLNNVTPKIVPIQNTNGVGIGSISYNSSTKQVTVTLSVGFSTAETFPFAVNDKVIIENVNIKTNVDADSPVGVGTTIIGYNSENYNYPLFTLTSVTENRGGIGSVTYSLNGLLSDSQIPGIFDPDKSSGRIVPEKYFPTFEIQLQKNNYLVGEFIKSKSVSSGYVEQWNPITNQLRAVSAETFLKGEVIEGMTSKSQGIAGAQNRVDAFFKLDSSSLVDNGWISNAGFLNTNTERIQDSDFYQNFSYSIKSAVSYDTWDDAVSTLNHTTGFKKFAEYQLETKNNNLMDIKVQESLLETTFDLTEIINLNCVFDFDLVSENSLSVSNRVFSDQITFSSRILSDYSESIGNRVLLIDDVSSQFNSNPRSTKFSEVHRFSLNDARAQKYITYIQDRRFTGQRQLMLVSLIHADGIGFISQYARLESSYDLGSFDFSIEGSEGVLNFYPTKFSINDYTITTLSYNLADSISGVGTSTFGNAVTIQTSSGFVSSGSTTIVGVGTTYNSAKILVEITGSNGQYEFDELNLVHDGTNVELLEYGQITNHSLDSYSSSGLGTYYPYISGSELKIDFYPNPGIAATFNTFQTLMDGISSGIGTYDIKHARIQGSLVSIASSTSPTETSVISYPGDYDGSYCLIQVSDTTNNRHQLSEIVILDDQTDESSGEVYLVEFGNVETSSGLGTFGARKNGTSTELTFTPLPSIDVKVVGFLNTLRIQDDEKDIVSFENGTIETNYGTYEGTERDIKRAFGLTHNGYEIFRRDFVGSASSIVNVDLDTITIPNHFFVTGEKVVYTSPGIGNTQAIGIASTDFGVGIGITDRLPSSVYVVKVDQNTIKLSRNVEDALNIVPKILNLTSVGIETAHSFTATNQNAKVIVAIDNVIQSPMVSTAQTTSLFKNVFTTDDLIYLNNITSFFGGDLIKIGDEIMRIDSVGIGSTNAIRVRRPWMGTTIAGYSTGSLVTKVDGNYNIVDNTLNFASAPYGNLPEVTTKPDERDWLGISTSSSFQGRTFLRSGVVGVGQTNDTYHKNYVFTSISEQFDGKTKSFSLKSNGSDVTSISNENAVILINDIFQGPGLNNDYSLGETAGITSITFTGTATSIAYDVNTASIPKGGIIVSVGSTEGFGYQSLVSAGGTAIISGLGTISSISIGNSGSGYRSGSQVVRVGVATSSTGTPTIQFIGTAVVSNGHVVSVAITNPGSGYTSTNPPYVVIDDPLSYLNIPLVYSSSSSSGVGSQATIDVVVGQGSSVIDFEIKNLGYGYRDGEILTIPVGGIVGIPTDPTKTFKEFQISVQKTSNDKFTGWSIGELQILDNIQNLFDGSRTIFPLKVSGILQSFVSSPGSNIDIKNNLLVFVNDILQVPNNGYKFNGGSQITFTEPPKVGDTCKILFYKGTGSIDVIEREIIETVKDGDRLTIGYDSSLGQSQTLQETERTVAFVESTNLVRTLPYYGPGISSSAVRPVLWCRQTEDKIINGKEISKDRELYEPIINPFAYIIKSVGIGSTIIYVDNIRPFFNPLNENNSEGIDPLKFQNEVTIISQNIKVGASATAIVSTAGTVSSINITDGGFGYNTAPSVKIETPVGLGTTQGATGIASITSGIVTSIIVSYGGTETGTAYTTSNPPIVLIEPPSTFIEKDSVNSYQGDFGIITGISTTSVGIASTALVFDFAIPINSFLRNSSITGLTTISGISTGDYFVVYNSNVGSGVTSLDSSGSIVGMGTTFLDNIYQVVSVSIAQTSTVGLGITYVAKVVVSVSSYNNLTGIGFSNFYGEYSWGKISLKSRTKEKSYDAYTLGGYAGITTGTIVKRSSPLKYLNYIP